MKLVVLLIVSVAVLLRVVNLGLLPSGFTPDEASFGYDAYSILKTGSDQWGHFMPLVLESFGDFKAPLYAYLLLPFIYLFGLSETIVRLPNALLGATATYVAYLLTVEIITWLKKEAKIDYLKLKAEVFGALASFFVAISPWHVMMSRGGFEANLTTFFLPLGTYLFLRGLRTEDDKYLPISALIFGLNLFSYHSAKLITPLSIIISIVFLWKYFVKTKPISRYLFLGITGFFVLVSIYTFTIGSGARAKEINIMNGTLLAAFEKRQELIESGVNPLVARILNNKYQVLVQRFIDNYSQYFSYQFFISRGPAETTYGMIPGIGIGNFLELVGVVGFLVLLFRNTKSRIILILVLLLLVSPVPAALTTGPGYAANRAVSMNVFLQIIYALGFMQIYSGIKTRSGYSTYFLGMVVLLEIVFGGVSLLKYYHLSPIVGASGMLYGRLNAVRQITWGEKVIMDTSLSEPHIYVAFANKVDPRKYQMFSRDWKYKDIGVNWVDQMPEYSLGNYTFKDIKYPESSFKGTLVGKPTDFGDVRFNFVVNYPNGEPAVYLLKSD